MQRMNEQTGRWNECTNRYMNEQTVNAWPNGNPLAYPFGQDLRALALTCEDLRSLWSRSNLHASERKFFTVWPPDPSHRKFFCFKYWIVARAVAFKWLFEKLRALACPFDHPTQGCMQVQLATTCVHLRYRLARALEAIERTDWRTVGRTHERISNFYDNRDPDNANFASLIKHTW